MACKIRVLDEKTINQIAAGEVIENPASVVKELVDNALDAGATKIVVEVQGSGRQSILVQDNGSGMGRDDALLCLERHATSKIRSFDDLWLLSTMGFRGEALASIASVSDLSILTAESDEASKDLLEGTSIFVSAGKIISCSDARCFRGTSVQVKSLFHNVPARRKFQKSPAKDATDITKIVSQLALANPKVGFELILNQKKELDLAPIADGSFSDRIKNVLGKDFFSELIPLDYSGDCISLSGFVGKPSSSKPTRMGQYLFVNGRPVVSLSLSSAIKEAYGTSIDASRHPIFVLYAHTATDLVDVNVHPQKKEVRFHMEEELKNACGEAVSMALFKVPILSHPQTVQSMPSITQRWAPQERKLDFQYQNNRVETPVQAPERVKLQPLPGIENQFQVIASAWHYIFVKVYSVEDRLAEAFSDLDAICLIDSKQALSRIAFETVIHHQESPSVQTLLVPLFIELSPAEALELKEKIPFLQKLGVHIYEFGVNAFLIDALPACLENIDMKEWIRSVILDGAEEMDIERVAMLAAKAQTVSSPLSNEMALQIVKKLFSCKEPFKCPSGLPVISFLTKTELMKKFQI